MVVWEGGPAGGGPAEPPVESALIVAVPAAEPVVREHRLRLDTSAAVGVPAHVTVLYPFMPAELIDEAVLATIARVVATVPAFEGTWPSTGWFGEQVLWLSPEPADSFRALTQGVMAAFPDYPPYGGEHDGLTPHLTVGDDPRLDELRAAERDVLGKLPITMLVTHVQLITGNFTGRSFAPLAQFPLA